MLAYQIVGGFGLSQLQQVTLPDLKPDRGQVLVLIKACSLNYRDWMMVTGIYNPSQPLPLTPLSDGVGDVIAVGDDVSSVRIGDRVAGIFAQGWLSGPATKEVLKTTLGGPLPGMLSQYALLSSEGVVDIPPHLSYVEAATLPCAALTAWHALVVKSQVKPNDTVLLQGTGGVSIFALQFAKILGARAILISSSDEKLARAKKLGADHTINYKTHPEWSQLVRELTNGNGVDHIVEVGGADTLSESILAARYGGQINIIGALSGGTREVDVRPILMRQLCLQGVFTGNRDYFEDMNNAIIKHQLRPVVDRVFPFSQTREAFAYFEKSSHFGKVCIEME